jgi:steroid delta-isomerase-like uncharacterized protein
MNEEETRLVHRSHHEAMIEGNEALIEEIYGEDFVNHSRGLPEYLRHGPESIRQQYRFLRSAFSDMEMESHQQTVEGNLIGLRWTWKARHTGDFLGIPATGAEVRIDGFDMLQIEDGKIRAAWIIQDSAGLMAQLQAAAARSGSVGGG